MSNFNSNTTNSAGYVFRWSATKYLITKAKSPTFSTQKTTYEKYNDIKTSVLKITNTQAEQYWHTLIFGT